MTENNSADAPLADLVINFTEAFNIDDLDLVMSYFGEDAIYDEFNGIRHRGKAAIRAAFQPQFAGKFGKMRFHTEDMFLEVGTEPNSGKAMIRWLLTIEDGARAGGWRGLDLLHFKHGRLLEKHTYAKTRSPVVEKKAEAERVRMAIDEGTLSEL